MGECRYSNAGTLPGEAGAEGDHGRADVGAGRRDAVAAVHAAIEIVDSRIADWKIKLIDTIADNASYGGFTLGPWDKALPRQDLAALAMRILHNGELAAEGAPASLVGKFPAANDESRQTGVMLGNYVREVNFYRHLAGKALVQTPRCWFTDCDDATADPVTARVLKNEVQGDVDELKTALAGEDDAAVKTAYDKLMESQGKLGEAIYSAGQAEGGAEGAAEGEAASDDDVVDAEVVEDDEADKDNK